MLDILFSKIISLTNFKSLGWKSRHCWQFFSCQHYLGHPVYCSDCLEDYVEYVGEVHQTLTLPSMSKCQKSCVQPWQCTHWTYHKKTGQCSLLNGKTEEHHRKPNMISGTKYCDTENHVTIPANRAKGDLDLVSVICKYFYFRVYAQQHQVSGTHLQEVLQGWSLWLSEEVCESLAVHRLDSPEEEAEVLPDQQQGERDSQQESISVCYKILCPKDQLSQ